MRRPFLKLKQSCSPDLCNQAIYLSPFHPNPAKTRSGSRRHAFAIFSSSPGTNSVPPCSVS
jgi:hypothetical protein